MAMNSSTLASAIAVRLKALYRNDTPVDQVQDNDYFLNNLAKVIAEEVVDHIVSNAKCLGVDSGGDSHDAVGII